MRSREKRRQAECDDGRGLQKGRQHFVLEGHPARLRTPSPAGKAAVIRTYLAAPPALRGCLRRRGGARALISRCFLAALLGSCVLPQPPLVCLAPSSFLQLCLLVSLLPRPLCPSPSAPPSLSPSIQLKVRQESLDMTIGLKQTLLSQE